MSLEKYEILQVDSFSIAQPGEAFSHQFTIINFWATWYPPCLKEMPILDEFYKEFKEKNVQVLGITGIYRDSQTSIKKDYLQWVQSSLMKKKISYPILFDIEARNTEKF